MAGKIIASLVGGFVFSILAVYLFHLIFGWDIYIIFPISWLLAIFVGLKSPDASESWQKHLALCTVVSFMIPMASMINTSRQTSGDAFLGGLISTGVYAVIFPLLGLCFWGIRILVKR